ncbi:MAG: sulfatase-like hydrolase/transferase [Gammaproteobacteria bacterium]|nr:sulfatase-like hydrolase/transferase [Gammaproteobacteria bacterium]
MRRLRFWIATALLLASAASVAQSQPNIVLLVADDLGYADVGFRGSDIDTPALDRLAREGRVLNRFYTAPICSPTRAALMTGRDPMRLGVAYNVLLPWDNGGIHPRERFMSESFQAAGYQTAMIGKWHLGHAQQQFTPLGRGFDEFYGHLHTEVGYYPPFSIAGGKDFQHNGVSIDHEGYETFLLAEHAAEWIRQRDKQRPFFIYLPFLAPHENLEAPDDLIEKYQGLKDQRDSPRSPSGGTGLLSKVASGSSKRALYAAVVDAMDQAIGKVLDTLDKEGLTDNTIVVFFSDNGATRMVGRGGGDNAPFRGGKAETYEGGIRVVSMVRWPGQVAAGSETDNMLTVMDLFPTLAAAAKVPTGNELELDGDNMLPAWLRDDVPPRDKTVFFGSEIPTYGNFNFAAITEHWKLVQWVEQDPVSTTVRHELFNLTNDPGEYNNLAQKYPDKVQKMARQILEWRALHPINGTRARLAAPPGWRAPKDWARYPRQDAELQNEPRSSVAPNRTSELILDRRLGKRGRLIYNCQPSRIIGGLCLNELIQ